MTARGTWKAYESRVAKDLGGRRIPVTGIDRDGADVVTPLFHVQVKLRNALPAWLWRWLSGIVGTATAAGKIGGLLRGAQNPVTRPTAPPKPKINVDSVVAKAQRVYKDKSAALAKKLGLLKKLKVTYGHKPGKLRSGF